MYLGTCLCGEVTISVSDKISDIIHCHCSLCRKNSGTAYATNGFVKVANFNVITGHKALSKYSFKPGSTRHFCSICGSPVYSSTIQDPSRVRVRLGIFDSDINENPISHNFVSSKANWDELNDALPHYDAFEPSRT